MTDNPTPPVVTTQEAASKMAMTPLERRASLSLASIYALRMLGLFLVLPVFALEAHKYPGGDDPALVGLAMGIYGLTQGILQLPFGMASDRIGRKRVLAFGLLVFAAGSYVSALAPTLTWLVAGRALQGAGAVSAVVTALLADQTRDEVRTKAMALVGASIGLMFALSLVAAPILATWFGLSGLFALIGSLAVFGVVVVIWWVPPEPVDHKNVPRGRLSVVLMHVPTLRLHFGVFVMHAVLIGIWVGVPTLLIQAGLGKEHHWWVYLPAVFGSFGVMGATLFSLERKGYLRAVFLAAIGLLCIALLGLSLVASRTPGIPSLLLLLFVFFCGSNILEASQPSIASRAAPPNARGAALGLYNTLQSLGFFAGGLVGGMLVKNVGIAGLFLTGAAIVLVWLLVAWPMPANAKPLAQAA